MKRLRGCRNNRSAIAAEKTASTASPTLPVSIFRPYNNRRFDWKRKGRNRGSGSRFFFFPIIPHSNHKVATFFFLFLFFPFFLPRFPPLRKTSSFPFSPKMAIPGPRRLRPTGRIGSTRRNEKEKQGAARLIPSRSRADGRVSHQKFSPTARPFCRLAQRPPTAFPGQLHVIAR